MNHPLAWALQCISALAPATFRPRCSWWTQTTLWPSATTAANPLALQSWKHCRTPSLDALWVFQGDPNASSQEHATTHRKVRAKADLAPARPGKVPYLLSLGVKDSAQTAGATSSQNIGCFSVSQKDIHMSLACTGFIQRPWMQQENMVLKDSFFGTTTCCKWPADLSVSTTWFYLYMAF